MGADFMVVICTRDRPRILLNTLNALAAQAQRGFAVMVVDQSASADPDLEHRIAADPLWSLFRDDGRGVAR
ncbi:MAG: glycosyl transferase, partial [Actinomycetota bacterium]|nr:glycosyl transferase [Actinomycetota bacterium]